MVPVTHPAPRRVVNVGVPRAMRTPTTLAVINQRPVTAVRVGGFNASPQLVVVPGAVLVWAYSPYVGTSVEVPATPAPDNPAYPACQTVADCGDGQLGHGAACDRVTAPAADGSGVCREACRNDADCDSSAHCQAGLDPDGPEWAACVPG